MGMKFSTVPEWGDGTGTIGDPVGAGTSGTLQVGSWGGNNIVIPAAEGTQAFFKIVANLNDLTYKITRTDWVITGDFNGWGLSTFLKFNPATELLTWTGDMTAGKYRFVANSWADNMGDKDNDGIIDIGEHNITLTEAGNYTVTLDLTGAIYTYTIKKN
jgi:hypothetical protein